MSQDIVAQRLVNQGLANPKFQNPTEVVEWLGAVQAQDYAGSLWGIGQRTTHATLNDVENAISTGRIVRTWPMRGTLHFVSAADIRWMLELLTPRVVSRSAWRDKQLELDDRTFARSKKVLVRALEGGRQLTRTAAYQVLENAKIRASNQRGLHILFRLAQEGLICFGPRSGKQPTFVLLEEWVPNAKRPSRDEALATVAIRYFRSHGPATLQDFVWWSGLTVSEAREAIRLAEADLFSEFIEGRTYWHKPGSSPLKRKTGTAFLLPAYDEYTVAYKERAAVIDPMYAVETANSILGPTIVLDGRVAGTWRRKHSREAVVITAKGFGNRKPLNLQSLKIIANRYAKFIGTPVIVR